MISQYDINNYAQYQPLSVQEIWAPGIQLRQQQDQLQEEYANAEQVAQQGFSGLNPNVDKEALAIHKQFIDQTKDAADQLATRGFIDSGRRRSLMQLKSVYSNQIAPLQQQIALRANRSEELRKIQLQDPTFKSTSNPNAIGLTEGMKNPNAYDYTGVSGNQMAQDVAKQASEVSKNIDQLIPEVIKNPKIKFDYFSMVQSGASPSQISNAMKQHGYDPLVVDKLTNLLHGIVDSTMQKYGVYDKFKGNDNVINDLWQSASGGLYSATGTKQFGQLHDSWSEDVAKSSMEFARQKVLQQTIPDLGYPVSDTFQNPMIANNTKFKELNDLKSKIESIKTYTPSSKLTDKTAYSNYELEMKKYNKEYDTLLKSGNFTGSFRPAPIAPTNYDSYANAKIIEDAARKYGGKTIGEINNNINQQIESQKELTRGTYIDDKNHTVSGHILNNIKSNTKIAQSFMQQTGIKDISKVNSSDLRYGYTYKGQPFVSYSKSDGTNIPVILPHEVSGISDITKTHRTNEIESLYDDVISGNMDINKHVKSGMFEKLPNGKYALSTFNHSSNRIPIQGRPNGLQTEFTENEIKNGINNNDLKYLLDKSVQQITGKEMKHMGAENEFKPTIITP